MLKRILLIGKKGRGKDTLAEFIADQLPDTVIMGFADELKHDLEQMVLTYYGEKHNSIILAKLLERREFMGLGWQWLGELMRQDTTDYWIRRLNYILPDNKNVVIKDTRHQNEAAWGIRNGYLLVKIDGPDHRATPDSRSEDHASERYVDSLPYDLLIDNSSTLDALHKTVPNILAYYDTKR